MSRERMTRLKWKTGLRPHDGCLSDLHGAGRGWSARHRSARRGRWSNSQVVGRDSAGIHGSGTKEVPGALSLECHEARVQRRRARGNLSSSTGSDREQEGHSYDKYRENNTISQNKRLQMNNPTKPLGILSDLSQDCKNRRGGLVTQRLRVSKARQVFSMTIRGK